MPGRRALARPTLLTNSLLQSWLYLATSLAALALLIVFASRGSALACSEVCAAGIYYVVISINYNCYFSAVELKYTFRQLRQPTTKC